jgi:hypothetical protein
LRLHSPAELGAAETAGLRELVRANGKKVAAPRDLSTSTFDWTLLLDAAERHRLAPLVHDGLRAGGDEIPRPPEEVRARLENIRILEIAKAMVRLHHVDELGALALRAGMDLYLLKGAAFATTLYPDPGLRPMSDIDVLARPGDFESWCRELSRLGYSLIDVSDHARCYRREATGVLVELHRELTSAAAFLGLEIRAILSRARPVDPAGAPGLSTLSWEDHLLHLCLHGSFQHGFRQPGLNAWDALSIVERTDFDFDLFVALAREGRLAPWVYGGLSMTNATFESPKLSGLLSALADAVPRAAVEKARGFRAERLLAPVPDALFGTPLKRLDWTGWNLTTLSLLLEVSRPRTPELRGNLGARLGRIWQLVSNHGLALTGSTSKTASALRMGPTPASLGEVRDV